MSEDGHEVSRSDGSKIKCKMNSEPRKVVSRIYHQS